MRDPSTQPPRNGGQIAATMILWISIKVHLADLLVVPMTFSANATQPQLTVTEKVSSRG